VTLQAAKPDGTLGIQFGEHVEARFVANEVLAAFKVVQYQFSL
jgi:hypothetical protein